MYYHFVFQESLQIHGYHHNNTDISGILFHQSSKGAIDIGHAFKAYFNGPAGIRFCTEFPLEPRGIIFMHSIYNQLFFIVLKHILFFRDREKNSSNE
jgi:hypothetical protein